MEYMNIFALDGSGITYLYVILTTLGCCLGYIALAEFGYNQIVEKIYFSTIHFQIIHRTQIYLLLINFPYIVLTLSGIIYNSSLLPFEVSIIVDEILILLVAGYICYVEESRQSPVKGFTFVRDCIFLLSSLGIISLAYQDGGLTWSFMVIFGGFYLLYYLIQRISDSVEGGLLFLFQMKESNSYNAKFLLTEKSHPIHFLHITDTIQLNQQLIQQEIQDFQRVAFDLSIDEEQAILINFAKIFIPIKKACEINYANENSDALQAYQKCMKQRIEAQNGQNWKESGYMQNNKANSVNESGSCLMFKKTTTFDSVLDPLDELSEEKEKEAVSVLEKVVKVMFYPFYLSQRIEGKLRYFMDYFIIVLLGGVMFVLANCFSFASYHFPNEQCLISLVGAGLLFYPCSKYFYEVSAKGNDCDFINIFIQGLIAKNAILSVGVLVSYFINNNLIIQNSLSNIVVLAIRFLTFLVYMIFMISMKFATRDTNFKKYLALFILSHLARIITENILDNI